MGQVCIWCTQSHWVLGIILGLFSVAQVMKSDMICLGQPLYPSDWDKSQCVEVVCKQKLLGCRVGYSTIQNGTSDQNIIMTHPPVSGWRAIRAVGRWRTLLCLKEQCNINISSNCIIVGRRGPSPRVSGASVRLFRKLWRISLLQSIC